VITDIQYSAGCNDWPELRDAVRRAEDEGYATTWVFDHFDGSMIGGDRPMLEAFTLLGALAEVTSSIGLGTLVANVNNRHPALLGLAASSAQRISGGRLTVGIGAGSGPGTRWAREHEERGIALLADVADRHRAVVAHIAAVRAATDAPVFVGANSTALAELAGREADGVNVRISHPRAAELLAAARRAAGERPFDLSAYAVVDQETDIHERAADLGLDRLVLVDLGPLAGR
jgi:alkanesulfonate monooxygenase SsuD/methylene tetrahydromethanopterin reductase-like flavin-dependent oxidoreductase (luciferase family)